MAALIQAGLAEDEAFLVAVKRMGSLDALSREFAREHSDRLWKQLVIAPDGGAAPETVTRTEALVVKVTVTLVALIRLRRSLRSGRSWETGSVWGSAWVWGSVQELA